jgi:hypothetical protein
MRLGLALGACMFLMRYPTFRGMALGVLIGYLI